jgi:membrane peptidoglycan carboxypeptidase
MRASRRRRDHPRPYWVIALSVTAALIFGGSAEAFDRYRYYTSDLPVARTLLPKELAQVTDIFDRNGELLYVKHTSGEIRTVVPLSEISPNLVNATVALEDHAFFQHHGINPFRIASAAWQDFTRQRIEQGASTITQQLVKASFFKEEKRSYEIKVKEALMALELERRYSKKEILTLYLNQIFYGRQAYGAEAAAQTYFGKPAKALTVPEAAMLAGIPQQPSRLDPINPKRFPAAKARQEVVLNAMRTNGVITPAQHEEALAAPLVFSQNPSLDRGLKAPHFVDYVLELLTDRYGKDVVEGGGLRVYTSLDYGLQKQAEEFTAHEVALQRQRGKTVNTAAMVAIDPGTGQILAMVGSPQYNDLALKGQYNMVTDPTGRQPGSSFKLYVYATAFSSGLTPATVVNDLEFRHPIDPSCCVNWDRVSRGPQTLRIALRDSRNIPAVRLFQALGAERVTAMARAMGISTPIRPFDSSALGGSEVNMLEHVNAYAVVASGGVYRPPVAILKVVDNEGKMLEEYKPGPGVRVLSPQVAWLLSDILKGVWNAGGINRPFASKTGTTNEWKDSWLIGFNPDIVVGGWMAHREPDGAITGMWPPVWGVEGAGQIVRDFFNLYEQNRPPRDFPQPAGMVRATVCRPSGLKPTPLCGSQTVTDWFIQGTTPGKDDDWYKQVRVCRVDGKLAPADAPDVVAENRTFLVYPNEYPTDWRDPKNPPVPTETCSVYSRTTGPTAAIVPPPPAHVGDLVSITVNVDEPGGAVREVVLTILSRYGAVLQQVHLTDPAGFIYAWDTKGQKAGTYALSAQAFDYANLASTPVTATLQLLPPPPPPSPTPTPTPIPAPPN